MRTQNKAKVACALGAMALVCTPALVADTNTTASALGLPTYGRTNGIPAVDATIRFGENLYKTASDPFVVEAGLEWDAFKADLDRLARQVLAPYRHARKFYDNRFGEK